MPVYRSLYIHIDTLIHSFRNTCKLTDLFRIIMLSYSHFSLTFPLWIQRQLNNFSHPFYKEEQSH